MLRVLVVDDSSFVRKALSRILQTSPEIRVVAEAATGAEALKALARVRIDVVTLDVQLPDMYGLDVLRTMVALWPSIPVLMLSACTQEGAAVTVEALTLGAADFIDKTRFGSLDFARLGGEVQDKIRALVRSDTPRPVVQAAPQGTGSIPELVLDQVALCAVGASTGGPSAVQALLQAARADLPFPIVVAQHMPAGFTGAFAARLDTICAINVRELVHGEPLVNGCAYVVPGQRHARVRADLTAELFEDPALGLHIPSVDALFSSVARLQRGRMLGILLTGMGRDGAKGLLDIRNASGWTIGQDEATSVVYGMPRVAMELGAVAYQLPLPSICNLLR